MQTFLFVLAGLAVAYFLFLLSLLVFVLANQNYKLHLIERNLASIAASARLVAGLTVDEITRPVDRVSELTRRSRMGRN